MRITWLVLLVGCETIAAPAAPMPQPAAAPRTPPIDAPPPPRCELVVLQHLQTCDDIRSGLSGFHVLVVASGEHAGKSLVVPYGDGNPIARPGTWNIAKLRIEPRPVTGTGWPNSCLDATSGRRQPMTTLGYVEPPGMIETFPDEATARAELARRCTAR